MLWPIGKKIVGVHQISTNEEKILGWSHEQYSGTECTAVLVLDDGSWIVPSSDPEGNRGGTFFVRDPNNMEADEFAVIWPNKTMGRTNNEFCVLPHSGKDS